MDAGWKVQLFAYNQTDLSVEHESFNRYNLLGDVTYFIKPPISKFERFITFLRWTRTHYKRINWSSYFQSLNVFKFGKVAFSLKLFYESQWFLTPFDFHIIHTHFGMNGNRIAYLKSKGILSENIRIVNSFHGYDLAPDRLPSYKKEYKYLFDSAAAFTVNTPYLEGLLKKVTTPQKPCYILPVGLDTEFFKRGESKRSDNFFDLVFCGKLIALKGPDLAIELVQKLHESGFVQTRLHIIGDGKLRDSLEQQVQRCQLDQAVFFYGALSQTEIKLRFESADAFVLPGRYDADTGRAETQGLVIQEAQAMELPVIVSDVGGMPYGLIPNKTGFVIKEGAIDGFAEAVQKLLLSPELKNQMGKAGRNFVKNNYDNKILVKNLIDIYQYVSLE